MDFVDTSTVNLGGVVRVAGSSDCYVDGVQVCLDSGVCGFTDDQGRYALAAGIGQTVTLTARRVIQDATGGESIIVENSEYSYDFNEGLLVNLQDNHLGLDFFDNTLGNLTVAAFATDCEFSFGEGTSAYIKLRGCDKIVYLNDITNEDQVYYVPAQQYDLFRVETWGELLPMESSSIVDNYMETSGQNTRFINLLYESQTEYIVYYVEPTITIDNLDTLWPFQDSDTCSLAEALKTYTTTDGFLASDAVRNLKVRVEENFLGSMCSSRGSLRVQDYVSGNVDVEYSLYELVELVEHEVIPTEPNVQPPYQLLMLLTASIPTTHLGDGSGTMIGGETFRFVVFGYSAIESSFFAKTTSDPLPVAILRDPPLGRSFSQMSKSTSLTSSISSSSVTESGFALNGKMIFGGQVSGIYTDVKVMIGATADFSAYVNSASSSAVDITLELERTITTSADPGLAGKQSDIIVGLSLIIEYSISSKLDMNMTTCEISKTDARTWTPTGMAPDTGFVFSHFYIENMVIPRLHGFADDANLEEVVRIEAAEMINAWTAILEFKDETAHESAVGELEEGSTVLNAIQQMQEDKLALIEAWNPVKKKFKSIRPVSTATGSALAALAIIKLSPNIPGNLLATIDLDLYGNIMEAVKNNSNPNHINQLIKDLRDEYKDLEQQMRKWSASFFSESEGAHPVKKIAIDGNVGGYSQRMVSARTSEKQFSFDLGFAGQFSLISEVESPNFEQETAAIRQGTLSFNNGFGLTKENTVETYFEIADANPFDAVYLEILEDTTYGTPIFNLLGGMTSCPYEGPPTSPVENPKIVLLVCMPLSNPIDVIYQFHFLITKSH